MKYIYTGCKSAVLCSDPDDLLLLNHNRMPFVSLKVYNVKYPVIQFFFIIINGQMPSLYIIKYIYWLFKCSVLREKEERECMHSFTYTVHS